MSRFIVPAALASVLLGSPAFAQVIADPPFGSIDASENMLKVTNAIPERVRTYDPEVTGGIKVRSELADKPESSAPRQKPH